MNYRVKLCRSIYFLLCYVELPLFLNFSNDESKNETDEQNYWYQNDSGYTYFPEKYLKVDNLSILDDNDNEKQSYNANDYPFNLHYYPSLINF